MSHENKVVVKGHDQTGGLGVMLDAMEAIDRIRHRIDRLGLDLSGLTVVTEAATGFYAVTAVVAAMANARKVYAVARSSHHGRFEDAMAATAALAAAAGVSERIEIASGTTPEMLGDCDILTNSGHLRPITRKMIQQLPNRAVIGLMFEAWEIRDSDIDLAACRERGIRVASVNERHPLVGVFAFLGPLCARLLVLAGNAPRGRQIVIVCNNPFAPFLETGLQQAGAAVTLIDSLWSIPKGPWDAVVIALNPAKTRPIEYSELAHLASVAEGALIAQFWGDIDRAAAAQLGLSMCPQVDPMRGHMGILLSALGPEPIIRLQAGGLRAAELVRRNAVLSPGDVAELL